MFINVNMKYIKYIAFNTYHLKLHKYIWDEKHHIKHRIRPTITEPNQYSYMPQQAT